MIDPREGVLWIFIEVKMKLINHANSVKSQTTLQYLDIINIVFTCLLSIS